MSHDRGTPAAGSGITSRKARVYGVRCDRGLMSPPLRRHDASGSPRRRAALGVAGGVAAMVVTTPFTASVRAGGVSAESVSRPSSAALQAASADSWSQRVANPWAVDRLNGRNRAAAPAAAVSGSEPAASTALAVAGWRLQASRNALIPNGQLFAVSCGAPTSCTAVGAFDDPRGVQVALVQHWDGRVWRTERVAAPPASVSTTLTGVSCASVVSCIAVGYYGQASGVVGALAERWDGVAWTLHQVPAPSGAGSNGLLAVSCTSAARCIAVGEDNDASGAPRPLFATWTGGAWTSGQAAVPAGSIAAGLFGVACATPSWCLAAGASQAASGVAGTLAQRWNGSRWSIEATPGINGASGSGFAGVACTGANRCLAVGSSNASTGTSTPLAERRAGSSWQIDASPLPVGAIGGELSGVACSAPTACTAAGSYAGPAAGGSSGSMTRLPLAEHWSGAQWQATAAPDPSGAAAAFLSAVACTSQTCTATGSSETSAARLVPLVERSATGSWMIQRTPQPSGAANNDNLLAVSCPAPGHCLAVGYSTLSFQLQLPLAESWNGVSWRITPTVTPPNATSSQLQAISCTPPVACTAVGSAFDGVVTRALVETWDGRHWRIAATPDPPSGTSYALLGVSCTGQQSCLAVGDTATTAGQSPLSEVWDGTIWRLLRTPRPASGNVNELEAVSCIRSTACTAVGFGAMAFAETWDGHSWRLVSVAQPAGAMSTLLFGVSCSSATACMAVGSAVAMQGVLPLADRWDGNTWSSSVMPLPSPQAAGSNPAAVTCTSASSCVAAGYYFQPNQHSTAFVESWDGVRWTDQGVPTPAGTVLSALNGVSCDRKGCIATGSSSAASSIQVTLAVGSGSP